MKASAKPGSMYCPQPMMNWKQMTQRYSSCASKASACGFAANLFDTLLISLLVPSIIFVLSVVLLISLIIL